MTVSAEDIDRWDAGDVREVFNAARSRAEAAFEASNGIAELPAFGTWGGEASEAAKESIGQTRKDLDAHGNEAFAVAQAARKAADEIDAVKASLAQLRADATSAGFEIDPIGNQVLPGPALQANMIEMLAAESTREALQARLASILTEAAVVDQELARAIAMATGASPVPEGPHTNDPAVQDILSKPLPEDPQAFADAWEQLTPEQKEWLYEQDRFIGNHDGMPFADRHLFNERHLGELQQDTQAELDRLRAAHPDWAAGDRPFSSTAEWQNWNSQWNAANKASQEYGQVGKALESPDGLPRYLGVLDDKGNAAVSINNPDEATRHATFVPGTGQDLSRLEFSTEKSEAMMQATLAADPDNLDISDVSVTTWMDYDRPMDLGQAASPGYAHSGADALQDFQNGLRVSHDDGAAGGPSTNTVIGHSYGSTLMGAASIDGYLDANNVVAVGSPGMLVGNAGDLNLPADANVFATRAQNDIIGAVTGVTLGPDPMSGKFGAIPFEAAPGKTWPFGLPSVDAHSSYWSDGNPALLNLGKIIAGQTNVTPPTFTP